mmetsp:Transcript_9082/g.13425  ORF Transcript_9082/g.13425 Transcript_9082/m.13425 type:complete len:724 (-) Transcript_9082:30-2201(-)
MFVPQKLVENSSSKHGAATTSNNKKWPPSSGPLPQKKLNPRPISSPFSLSVCSFNVLADSYCNPRSHKCLPDAEFVFDSEKRLQLLTQTLTRLTESYDVLCLQEVDLYDEVIWPTMDKLGYDGFYARRAEGRSDGCAVFWNKLWVNIDTETVDLDDLAGSGVTGTATATGTACTSNSSPVFGIVRSLLRKNVAALVVLEHVESKHRVALCNAHLFWNPGYEFVKLLQTKYLVDRVDALARKHSPNPIDALMPVVLCGDFNSKPGSFVHRFLLDGFIDARKVAPWRYFPDEEGTFDVDDVGDGKACPVNDTEVSVEDVEREFDRSVCFGDDEKNIEEEKVEEFFSFWTNVNDLPSRNGEWKNKIAKESKIDFIDDDGLPKVRYLLDFTLNRLCRWLRIFGIDAALETNEEERQRTKGSRVVLFERCRAERRTLVTTSNKLILRKDCPPGAYLINARDLESSLAHMLLTHGIVLEPSRFLTHCTVCNGSITEVTCTQTKISLFETMNAPQDPNMSVFSCDSCSQPYWWSEDPGSSAARVKDKATNLFKLALRAGVPIKGDLSVFNFVDVEAERQLGRNEVGDKQKLDVIHWLQQKKLKHSFKFQSAYDELPFTNVTSDFVGALDHIFFDPEKWLMLSRLHVPSTFNELNLSDVPSGHLLPSKSWPSDHLAIGVTLSFKPKGKHCNDCGCGCIPKNIMSMFEMAELRKKARAKKDKKAHMPGADKW